MADDTTDAQAYRQPGLLPDLKRLTGSELRARSVVGNGAGPGQSCTLQ